MSHNINGSWKKKLQSFLKGQGKLNTNSFENKAIVLELQGGTVKVVEQANVNEFLKEQKLQPNLTYKLTMFPTENGGVKMTAKDIAAEKANLFVVSPS